MSLFTSLVPLIAFSVNVSAQVLTARCMSGRNLLKTIFAGFGAGLFVLFSLEAYVYSAGGRQAFGDSISLLAANLIIYSTLGYGYFHFINLGVTARRIRLLIEIKESTTGLTLDEILSRYNAREMVSNRLGRLLGSGQVVLRDGRYFIGSPVMLFMSRAIIFMKLLVLGKRSEFD